MPLNSACQFSKFHFLTVVALTNTRTRIGRLRWNNRTRIQFTDRKIREQFTQPFPRWWVREEGNRIPRINIIRLWLRRRNDLRIASLNNLPDDFTRRSVCRIFLWSFPRSRIGRTIIWFQERTDGTIALTNQVPNDISTIRRNRF